ncbi:MAG TPA: type II toxin-antitoxin system HicA family toxin [Kiritimatiellia bacterium]|nr:type II toxin-antitoxin system HicA family toxin [Kiritimatiellia bacterium]
MPKLRPLSAREIAAILKANGFAFRRQAGSHLIFRRDLPGGDSATVPVPNRREIPVGTLKSIIELSGIDSAEFLK